MWYIYCIFKFNVPKKYCAHNEIIEMGTNIVKLLNINLNFSCLFYNIIISRRYVICLSENCHIYIYK